MISCSLLLVLLVLTCLQSFTTANNAIRPKECCVGFQTRPIPVRIIKDYRETDIRCSKPGVIFTLKNCRDLCGDPRVEWVKNRMNRIDQRLFNNQNKPTERD